jgi:hypothetical protein
MKTHEQLVDEAVQIMVEEGFDSPFLDPWYTRCIDLVDELEKKYGVFSK